ncbi:midnolin homolog [Vanessa cardui]|uniref:midnolin homolog n=1 Tax=Vanessa cardui TaxID=171605 RepID=UPI001F12E61D|nr:midnolin homolog [Vanessa cardui]
MERATGTEVYGCGSPHSTDITLNIQTTTGGSFSISLNGKNTVEHLKKVVSKKLKVSKDRICLLHRERQLRDGTLQENGVLDGSRIILLPSVETGLLSQRPENSVMQALESLNDAQVNDFLSGKSPLNLTMRLGDHMMLIQLQLSTLNSSSSGGSRTLRTSTPTKSSTIRTKCDSRDTPSSHITHHKSSHCEETVLHSDKTKQENQMTILQKQDLDMLQNAFDLYRTMAEEKYAEKSALSKDKEDQMDTSNCTLSDLSDTSLENEQSPIKSLSNLVSSPIDATTSENKDMTVANAVKSSLIDLLSSNKLPTDSIPSTSAMNDKVCPTTSHTSDSSISDDSDNFTDQSSFLAESTIDEYPMENLFNSAVDKGLFDEQDESMMDREISNLATTSHGSQETSGSLPSFQSLNEPLKNKRFQYLLHKTSKFKHPIGHNKQKAFMQSVVNKHKKKITPIGSQSDASFPQPSTSRNESYVTNTKKPLQSVGQIEEVTPSTSKQISFRAPDAPRKPQRASPTPPVDTKALIEASKNLTQKLKKLSKEVLTNKVDLRTAEESVRSKIGPGAVIESMKHHGKGIYSGTFSGTLNPALQDRYGRPKRDISTIIHILNDLLCAAPPIALSQKESKHSCSTKNLDEARKCLGCSQPSCSYGQCDGHLPSTSSKGCICDHKTCQCNRLDPNVCISCEGKSIPGETCKKCDMAKTLAMENSKTKCKLEQLRLVMQQKKQRREARKLKTLPYTTPSKAIAAAEKQAVMQEEIETVA